MPEQGELFLQGVLTESHPLQPPGHRRVDGFAIGHHEFLADGLRRARAPKRRKVSFPVFDMGKPLVDINDHDALLEAMERD